MNQCIIYGCGRRFDRDKFDPVKNRGVKPEGGLWASPLDSECGWRDWCISEDFNLPFPQDRFTFSVIGRVFTVDSVMDAVKLPWIHELGYGCLGIINFEMLIEIGFGAVWLTARGQEATRFSSPSLYGWDCESVLVLDPDCVHVGEGEPEVV